MEVDSQYFWSGAPWDMVARSYVAEALNNATGGSSYNQNNVLAVSAMEGIGLSSKFMCLKADTHQSLMHWHMLVSGSDAHACTGPLLRTHKQLPSATDTAFSHLYATTVAMAIVCKSWPLFQLGFNAHRLPERLTVTCFTAKQTVCRLLPVFMKLKL
eukprot:GHUV01024710.1.p1 GENE.GHUV01024710.1~~GHUV01024710.1.p1  ORF type:complete len:157 (-),score=18.39 GHUV01024710.1:567-1037(-)